MVSYVPENTSVDLKCNNENCWNLVICLKHKYWQTDQRKTPLNQVAVKLTLLKILTPLFVFLPHPNSNSISSCKQAIPQQWGKGGVRLEAGRRELKTSQYL